MVSMRRIAPAERVVVNVQETAFEPFLVDGAPLPGQGFVQLDRSFPPGTGFHIYRMEPGAVSQPHEHTAAEQFFVIEGELVDNDGTVYRQGDFVLLQPGTQHSSRTDTGCTLAVFVATPERNL